MQASVCYLSANETRSLCATASGLVPGEPTPGAAVVAVVDLPDESYVLATLPIMRGRDAALLRRRRLEREFPGATLTAIEVLRRRASDGVADAVMMAVNGGPALQETLTALGSKHALRAVTTPALLAGAWLRRARANKRRVLVVLPTPAGVRLIFLDDARPTLSRLTGPLSPASTASTATEIARTVQYLQNSQRVERGENVELWFWGMDDATAAACLPSGVAVVPGVAPRVAGLPDPERDGLDALLQLAAQSPGRLQLAPDELRLGWLAGGVERNGRLAAAVLLLLSVGLAGMLEWRSAHLETEIQTLVAERSAIETDVAQLNTTLQQRGLSLAEVATLPEAARVVSLGALSFDDVMRTAGAGFGAHPDVVVQRVEMRAAAMEAAAAAAPDEAAVETADAAVAVDAPEPGACATGPADARAVVAVEFGLAAGLDVRRRDFALAAVRTATAELAPWRTGAAARAIGQRDPLVVTDTVDAGEDAARWSVCLNSEATS